MSLADMPKQQLKIELFRLRLHNGIFVRQDPSEKKKILLDCIETGLRLSRKSSRGTRTWLTGEAKMLSEDQIYFQFGKISPDNVGYYDESGKIFLKKPAEKVDHTLIYMDVNLQLVGIVPNSKIAQKTVVIADNLGRAMSDSLESGLIVTLGSIEEPTEFVQQLFGAHAVKYFSVAYTLPNSNLSTDGLYRCLTESTEVFGADESAISIKSQNSIKNRDLMADCAQNANAAGYSAIAKIQETEDAGLKTIKLGANSATVQVAEKMKEKPVAIMSNIISHFKRIAKNTMGGSGNSDRDE